ncbi:MAG: hypothetical protein DWG83_02695 [Chloroflexi bacterium]|nr:hypothetical protein [Chloroflexota bacterium]
MSTRSALVIMNESHPAVATTLVLQEMGYTVDVGSSGDSALAWLGQARYEVIVTGGSGVANSDYLARLRDAAPDSRILALMRAQIPESEATSGGATRGGDVHGIEVVQPPFDVNALVEWLIDA